MKIVILAGGGGTRLWPWSRESQPKQLQAILGKDTLLQRTYKRLSLVVPDKDILIATGKQYSKTIAKQLPRVPRKNILIEPVRRDSAGAIGLAAAHVFRENPEEVLMSFHSDAWINNDKAFAQYVKNLEKIVKKNPQDTVIAGIKPSYPETGYGYIQMSKKIVQSKKYPVHLVKRFIEKPEIRKAQIFTRKKDYLWNPGWFAWRVDHLMSLYKKHLRKNYTILKEISETPQKSLQKVINKKFPKLKSIPIDYAILEKTKRILVVPAPIAWSDIGHWRSVSEMSKKDKLGNVVDTSSVLLDSENNLFISGTGKCITSIGIKNTVMIETDDVILLIDKSRAQDVKQLVSLISKKKKLKKYL